MAQEPRIKLEIDGDVLKCRDKNGAQVWETRISNILLIAEYTTNEGPWIDDYFLHFWSKEGDQLQRACITFYADGLDDVIKALSEKLGSKLDLGLCNSVEWKSRALWPPELANHPYFTFREVQPESWMQRVKRSCFGATLEYSLSDEVQAFLRRYHAMS